MVLMEIMIFTGPLLSLANFIYFLQAVRRVKKKLYPVIVIYIHTHKQMISQSLHVYNI
jgi:hypothetical protein